MAHRVTLGIEDQFSGPLQKLYTGMERSATSTDKLATRLRSMENLSKQWAMAFNSMGSAVDRMNQRLDTVGQASQQVATAGQTMKQYGAAAEEASTKVQKVGQAHEQASRGVVGFMGGVFKGLLLYKIVSDAMDQIGKVLSILPNAAIRFNATIEQTTIAFKNLFGSATLADDMVRKMFKFAAETPFLFEDVVEATRRLSAYGFAMEDIIPMMTAIGNAAAGLATGAVGIDRMSLALGQIQAKGKVQGTELRQLGEAGIKVYDIMQIVANKMGISLAQVIRLQEQGGLKAKVFVDAFKEWSAVKFGDMMLVQSRTFNGALSTISDNVNMVIAKGFKPLFDIISENVVRFAEFTKTAAFEAWSGTIKESVLEAIESLRTLATVIQEMPHLAAQIVPAPIQAKVQEFGGIPLNLPPQIQTAVDLFKLLTDQIVEAAQASEDHRIALEKEATAMMILPAGVDRFQDINAQIKEINRQVFIHPMATSEWKASQAEAIVELEELKKRLIEASQPSGPPPEFKLPDLPAQLKVIADATKTLIPLGMDFDRLMETVQKVSGSMNDFFVSLVNDAQKSGQVSAVFADQWKSSLGVVEEDADKFKNVWSLFADALKDKSVDVKEKATKAISSIMDDSAIAWADKYPLLLKVLDDLHKGALDVSDKVGKAMSDLFVKIINDVTGAGDVSALFADNWKAALGIVETDVDKFKNVFNLMANELKGKSKDVQIFVTSALSAVINDVTMTWEQKYTAILKIFDIVKKASLDAAQGMVNDWIKAGDAFIKSASGLEKIYEQFQEAPAKAAEKTFGAGAFEKERIEIQKLQAELPQIEEQIRRIKGTSSAVDLNWKYPDPNQIAELEAKQADYTRRINESNVSLSEMSDWNAGVGQRAAAGMQEAIAALGNYLAKWVMAQEIAGTITRETADRMYAAYEKTFGKALTKGEEFTLGVQRYGAEMFTFGEAGANAFAGLLKNALASKDPLTFIKDAVQDYKNGIMEAETQTDLLRLGLVNVATDAEKKTDPALEGLKKQITNALEEVGNFKAKLAEITSKVWNVEVKLIYTEQDGPKPKPPKPVAPPGFYYVWNEAAWRWDLMPGMDPNQGDANQGPLGGPAFEPPQVPAINVSGVEQVIGQIQRILNLIAGLSIDPRIKDMSDAVRSAMDSFKAGLDAITSLAVYTGKGVANVDKAFADMKTIADKFLSLYFLWAQSIDYERFTKVSESVGRALDAFKTGIDALILLADYTGKGRENIDKALADMMVIAQGFLTMSTRFAELDTDQAKLFAEAASAIFSAFKSGLDAIGGLAAYTGEGVKNATLAFNQMQFIVKLFMDAAAKLDDNIDFKPANAFAESTEKIFGSFKAGLDALGMLRNYTSPARSRIHQALDDLLYIARVIGDNARVIDPKIGESLRSIGEGVKSMVEPLIAIKKYIAMARNEAGIAPALEAFTRDLFGLFGRLSYLATWLKQQGELGKQMEELGKVLQSIFPPLVSAIDVLKGIRAYIPLARIGDVAPAFDAFMLDVQGLFGRLAALAQWLASADAAGAGSLIDAMKSLGEIMSGVFSPLKDALDVLVAIADYAPLKRVGKIAPALETFMNDVQGLFGRLGGLADWLAEREGLGQKMIDLGAVLSSVMTGIKAAADALIAIQDYADRAGSTASSVKESMLAFDAALRVLIDIIRAWAGSGPSPTGFGKVGDIRPIVITERMKDFAKLLSETLAPMQSVIAIVNDFVKLGKDLADGTVDMDIVIQTIDEVTRRLIDTMQSWYEGRDPIKLSKELRDYAVMMQEVLTPMQTVVSITQGAVDLAMSIYKEGYVLADAFTLIDTVTRELIDLVTGWSGEGADSAVINISTGLQDYAELLGAVLSPLQSVVSITSSAVDLAQKIADEDINLADTMLVIDDATRRMVSIIADWAGIGSGEYSPIVISEGMKTYAELLSAILAPMQGVIQTASGALDLAKRVAEGTNPLPAALDQVNIAAQLIILRIKRWMEGRAGDRLDIGTEMDPARNPLAQYSTLLSAILSPMQTIMSTTIGALDLAKRVSEGTESISDGILQMHLAASQLVLRIKQWMGGRAGDRLDIGTEMDPALNPLAQYSTLLSAILSPMQSVVSITMGALDLAKRVSEGTESLDDAMTTMKDSAEKLVAALKDMQTTLDLGAETDPTENSLAIFANLLSVILSPMQAIISTVSGALDLAKRVAEGIDPLDGAMTVIKDSAIALVAALRDMQATLDLGAETDPANNPLAQFANLLSAILAPMQTIISTVSSALDLSEKLGSMDEWTSISNIVEPIIFGADILIQALKSLQETLDIGQDVTTDPAENSLALFANLLSAILAPMQTIISTVSSALDLSEKLGSMDEWTSISNIVEPIIFGADILIQVLKSIRDTVDIGQDVEMDPANNPLAQFANLLSAVLAPMQTIISTVSSAIDLSENMRNKVISWANVTETIEIAVRQLVGLMADLYADTALVADIAAITAPTGADKKSFAERLSAALAPVGEAISVISSLVGLYDTLKGKTIDWGRVVGALADGIREVVDHIAELSRDPAILQSLKNVTPEFTEGLQRVFAPMSEAIDVMMKLGTYKALNRISRDRIPGMVQALADDIRDFLIAFELAAQGIDFTPELTELGEALAAIVGPVNDYILNYYWLGRYVGFARKAGGGVGSQWLPEPFLDLAQDLMMLVTAIASIMDQPGMADVGEVQGALSKAKEVSEAMVPVVDVVGDLLEIFRSLEYRIPDLGPISLVIGDIFSTLLLSLSTVMTTENMALMLNVSTYMRPFVDTMQETVEFLDYIAGMTVPAPSVIANVWASINALVTAAMQPVPWYDLGYVAGRSLMLGIVNGIISGIPSLRNVWEMLYTLALAVMDTMRWYSLGYMAGQNLIAGIVAGIADGVPALRTGWQIIYSIVTDALEPVWWYDLGNTAGRSLVQGLVDGITNNMDSFINAVRALRTAANNELLATGGEGGAARGAANYATAGTITIQPQTTITNQITVNVQGGQYDEQRLAELIGLQLGRLQIQYARVIVPKT